MTYTEIYDSWLNDKRLNAEGRKELENIKFFLAASTTRIVQEAV